MHEYTCIRLYREFIIETVIEIKEKKNNEYSLSF